MKIKEAQGCIYCARNKKTATPYVGQHGTPYVERRWNQHVDDAVAGSEYPFHRALRKNDYERGFTWEVLWRGPVRLLDAKETHYIKKLHSYVHDPLGGGYNITLGGVGVRGLRHTALTKLQISESCAAACAERLDEMNRISSDLWKDVVYKEKQYKGHQAARPRISASAQNRWKTMSAEERKAYMKTSAHTGAKWWLRSAEEQAATRAKLSAAWSSKSPEELAEIYARRGAGVRAAAVRRNALKKVA